jgi:outer membrane lipoprotein LolB
MRVLLALICCAALCACVTSKPPARTGAPLPWDQRVTELQQHYGTWQLDGRAAVAVGTQGWQASLNWRQRPGTTEVHLAGPLGIGAVVLKKTIDGLSLNGSAPSDAVVNQLQDKLGFALPLDDLRYWLVGVPNPATASEFKLNEQDRIPQLTQDGWTVAYDHYMPAGSDLLPSRVVLSREGVRVRIAVDHWGEPR